KIEIREQPSRSPSLRLIVDSDEVEAGVVVFAAGCGNLPFMEQLAPDHQYRIRQTPLLIVSGRPEISAPVFYDKINERSIVTHPPGNFIEAGCMIIGTRHGKRDIERYYEVEKRTIEDAEVNTILCDLEEQ